MSDWQTIKLSVDTPIFCGDANQEPELRVSSIKGEIRFWLRAILGGVLGNNLDLIAEVESSLLGSTERSSKVAFRIPQQPEIREKADSALHNKLNPRGNGFNGLAYMLGQGLCEYKKSQNRGEKGQILLKRGFIPTGATFELKMRFTRKHSPAEKALLQWAMWAAFVLGGIGARNRRGFGRVRVQECPDDLIVLAKLPPEALLSPRGRDTILRGMRQQATYVATEILGDRFSPASPNDDLPTFPSMGSFKWDTSPGDDGSLFADSWSEAFAEVGLELRTFRANEEVPRQGYSPARKTHEWLHTIHGEQKNHFPLGTLGLPIVFKKNESVSATLEGSELRWPSPLFLTLIRQGNGYRLISLFFITKFLPAIDGKAPNVEYTGPRYSRDLEVEDQDASLLAEEWIDFINGLSVKRFTPRF